MFKMYKHGHIYFAKLKIPDYIYIKSLIQVSFFSTIYLFSTHNLVFVGVNQDNFGDTGMAQSVKCL